MFLLRFDFKQIGLYYMVEQNAYVFSLYLKPVKSTKGQNIESKCQTLMLMISCIHSQSKLYDQK